MEVDFIVKRGVSHAMDRMTELLLTVLALSQEGYRGTIKAAIPKRLQPTLRKARKVGYVHIDDCGPYLEELGTIQLIEFGSKPFG